MNEEYETSFKEAQTALKDMVDFQKEIVGTIHKSHLQATQAILAGYSEVVQKAIDHCEEPEAPKAKAASKK